MAAYKFVINPYAGCAFGCEYCYARAFAPTHELRETWGGWVNIKSNAAERVAGAAQARGAEARIEPGDAIYMSSVTDPYQPVERTAGITRAILQVLIPLEPRLTIQTRSPLATRDIDLFQQFGPRIRVNMTVTTDDERVRVRYEPHCPPIAARLAAASRLRAAGVPVGISVSPMLPILEPEEFGRTIARLDPAECVTQYFKPAGGRFRAATSPVLLKDLASSGWTLSSYRVTRSRFCEGFGGTVLEGSQGYAPPG